MKRDPVKPMITVMKSCLLCEHWCALSDGDGICIARQRKTRWSEACHTFMPLHIPEEEPRETT